MATPRNGYTFALDDGTEIVLVEITPSELLTAAKDAGAEVAAAVRGVKVTRSALRQSVVKVGDKAVGYGDLDAAGWKRLIPRTRDTFRLANAWAQIHMPTEGQVDAVMASLVCESDGDGERWTVMIPGEKPRALVLAEVEPSTVEDALREASLSAKSEAAQGFQALISGGSRAIRSVDGAAVGRDELKGKGWDARFSVRETYLIGHAYNHIHGTSGETLGEVKPVRL